MNGFLATALLSLSLFLGSVHASEPTVIRFDPQSSSLLISIPSQAMPQGEHEIPNFLAVTAQTQDRVTLTGKLPEISEPDSRFGVGEGGAFLFSAIDWLDPAAWAGGYLRLESPSGYPGVASGKRVSELDANGQYIAEYRINSDEDLSQLHVFFGPYLINTEILELNDQSIELRTYFKPENQPDSPAYLRAVATYLEGYSNRIGPYPFERFSVVSAPLPVGLGLDRMTYVSEQILGHSYMLGRSLAHEVLHSWWGSGVKVNYQQGNWAEGLTTFMADYALAQQQSEAKAMEMRRGWLEALNRVDSYEPLGRFRYAPRRTDQSVGYGKSAMFFHMLHQRLGDEAFYTGIRQFWNSSRGASAGWSEIQHALAKSSGVDLSEDFEFWLTAQRLPRYSVEIADQIEVPNGFRVVLSIHAKNAPQTGRLPIKFLSSESAETRWVQFNGEWSEVDLIFANKIDTVVVDPHFEVLRRLDTKQ